MRILSNLVICGLLVLVTACTKEKVAEVFLPVDTHTTYAAAIQKLHLDNTTAGRQWLAAADLVFERPVPVALPFQEEYFFDAAQPQALAYEFTVPRGLLLRIDIESEFNAYFLDVFRVETGSGNRGFTPVATKPQTATRLEFTPRIQGRYLVRVQPELLEEGRLLLTITGQASLTWPVQDSTPDDIISYFGQARDGGARVHHGLDIKAPRGTLTLAAIAATGRPGLNERGGNVVRLFNTDLDVMLYYAHLDTQLINRNTPVQPGDTLGTVGTTGNARGGTPHLHIGVYDGSWRTPADPWYFFVPPGNNLPPLPAIPEQRWVTVSCQVQLLQYPAAVSGLRKSPARVDYRGDKLDPAFISSFAVQAHHDTEQVLQPGVPVRITGSRSGYHLITLPAGRQGYIAAADLQPLSSRPVVLKQGLVLYKVPETTAATVGRLAAGSVVEILAQYTGSTLLQYGNQMYWAHLM